jgi:hypothetical protein
MGCLLYVEQGVEKSSGGQFEVTGYFFLVVLFYLAGDEVKQSDLHLFRSAAKFLASLLSIFLSSRAAIKLSFHVDLGRPFPRLPACFSR